MSDLGQLLKKARTEKGIDLDQLQDSTKIQKRYLEAIEQGNYSVLPGNFYVRAFIKSYAEAVGLDPDEVLRLYRDVIPSPAATSPETVRRKRRATINPDRISKWVSTLLMWSFPIIIILMFYIYFTKFYEPKPAVDNNYKLTDDFEQREQEQDEDIVITPPPEEEPIEEEVEELPPEPLIEYVVTDGSTYIYNASQIDRLKVELKMVGDRCWVLVKQGNSGGDTLLETTLLKDHIETIEVDHSLYLRLGNPSTVEVTINDVLIDREKLLESNPWNLQINFFEENEQGHDE